MFRMKPFLAGIVASLVLAAVFAVPARAVDPNIGSTTGLPLPRFASLKSDRVNLREGPSKDHRTKWIYEKAGLPVEITAEFEDKPVPLRSKPNVESPMIVQLMPNVVASIKACDGQWCRLIGEGFDGYIQQQQLWGAYPEEKVE